MVMVNILKTCFRTINSDYNSTEAPELNYLFGGGRLAVVKRPSGNHEDVGSNPTTGNVKQKLDIGSRAQKVPQ